MLMGRAAILTEPIFTLFTSFPLLIIILSKLLINSLWRSIIATILIFFSLAHNHPLNYNFEEAEEELQLEMEEDGGGGGELPF